MSILLWWLGQNTIAVGVMVPFALLMCRLFRNRPAVQHVLWLVVLLKLVMPPIVSWPWSIQQVRNSIWSIPATAPVSETVHMGELDENLRATDHIRLPSMSPVKDTPSLQANARQVDVIVTMAWIIGGAVVTSWQFRRIASRMSLVGAAANAPECLTNEVQIVAKQLGLRPPQALIARGILSPFIWCLGRPRLVWPESLSSQTEVVRSRGVITHELAHIYRGDHWVAWLEMIVSIVWWWNPFFWFVRRRLNETAEMACDAMAIDTNPANRREYAELLLELSWGFKIGAPATILAIGVGTPMSFERRLSMILSDHVSGKFSSLGIVVAISFALLALPGCSKGQHEPQSEVDRTAKIANVASGQLKSPENSAVRVALSSPVCRELAPFEEFTGRLEASVAPPMLRTKKLPEKPMDVVFNMDQRSYLNYQQKLGEGQVKGEGDPLAIGLPDENNFPRAGVLDQFGDKFDPTTGTISVYGVLPNADDLLLPGMFVRVRMTLGPPRPVLEVPEEAVGGEKGNFYLWVVSDQDIVAQRAVQIGALDGNMCVIEKGVTPEDKVVIAGANGLRSGDHVVLRSEGRDVDGTK
ncbi:MAG TPA: M56 family metallopeptidase [Pirellulales bacterium]|jgi:beta-lactamase regulating signal transducer with metallopeptidase domain|nr:M56 family metallopeptidase [Pirellulales bacterium]